MALGQVIMKSDIKDLSYGIAYQIPVSAVAGIYYVNVESGDGRRVVRTVMLGEDR